MPNAKDAFQAELNKRGVAFSGPDQQGLYRLRNHGFEITVNLENISRSYERDRDPQVIIRFVDQVLRNFEIPSWADAKTVIYFSAEPANQEFGDAIHEKISDSVCKVLVMTDLREGRVTWLTPHHIEHWGVSREDVVFAASENMTRLLVGKQPQFEVIDGMKLGMVPIDTVFKASVIFSPNFKSFVSPTLGWPVFVTIPCRDFIYILGEKDKSLLSRMGGVVQKEYRESGYPITTEVLRISDEGIRAIGKFSE